jgi:type IX secretion system PorP/SprF family membrane protein
MKVRRSIACIVVACLGMVVHGQHSPITSQYLFNGLLINPAYAGSRDALTANLTHRQQWLGFEGAPVTQLLSVHSPVGTRKIGLGLMVFNDRIGVSRETGFTTSYAYRLRFPKGRLSLGLGAGMDFARHNWQDLALQQQNDAVFQTMDRPLARPNFSTGAFYYTSRSFIGLSLPFLLKQRQTSLEGRSSNGRLVNMQPMLLGGHVFTLNEDLKLKPSMLLRYTPAGGMQGDLSSNLIIREMLWLGASWRSGDAMVAMVEVLPTPQWRIGYSYDMGMSAIRRHHYGSHEIMLQYELGYRIRVRDPRYF